LGRGQQWGRDMACGAREHPGRRLVPIERRPPAPAPPTERSNPGRARATRKGRAGGVVAMARGPVTGPGLTWSELFSDLFS